MKHGNDLKVQTPISQIVHYCQNTVIIPRVPIGVYTVLVYDIESEGHLMLPTASPAIISSVVVLGTLSFDDDDQNGVTKINTAIDLILLTLTVHCVNAREFVNGSCIVILSSQKYPNDLVVKVQQRESSNPLVYKVEPETNYTITVYTVSSNGVANSSVKSTSVFIGMLMFKIHVNPFSQGLFCAGTRITNNVDVPTITSGDSKHLRS